MFDDRTMINPLSPRLEDHKDKLCLEVQRTHFSVRKSPEDALKLRTVAVLEPIVALCLCRKKDLVMDEDLPATTSFSRKTAVWAFSRHRAGVSSHPSIASRSS